MKNEAGTGRVLEVGPPPAAGGAESPPAAQGFRQVLRELQSAQKSHAGASLYSRYVNRPGGRVFTALFAPTPLTPNAVSALSAAFSLSAAVLVATQSPSIVLGVGVWLLLAVGFMLDSADGQLARLRRRRSMVGEWLDHVIDTGKLLAVHFAVLLSIYRFFDVPGYWLLVPAVFLSAVMLIYVGGLLTDLLMRSAGSGRPESVSLLRSLVLLLADYGPFCLVFLLLGWQELFLGAYALLALANLALLPVFMRRWYGRLAAADRAKREAPPV